jgi:hypothetical protein
MNRISYNEDAKFAKGEAGISDAGKLMLFT